MFEFEAKNYFNNYNTLDIDFDAIPDINQSCSKERIEYIIAKIKRCPFLIDLVKEDSNKKGYHLRFFCLKQCDLCRLVFDDFIRFDADATRNPVFTNIIFDKKRGY